MKRSLLIVGIVLTLLISVALAPMPKAVKPVVYAADCCTECRFGAGLLRWMF